MAPKKTLYTTSEYLSELTLAEYRDGGGIYQTVGKDFSFFSSAEAAEKDAQWFVGYCKREGVKKRKPVVYLVRLERVNRAKKRTK